MRKALITSAVISISVSLFTINVSANTVTTKASPTKSTQQTKPVTHTLANLAPIKITAQSTVRLTDVNILSQDDGSILTYTLTIINGESKSIDLLDYWSKVKSVSGTTFSTSLMTKDKDKKTLSAGSSTTLTYVAKVGKNIKPSDLVYQVIKWDFNQANYESIKGQFKIPATYLTATPATQSKTLKVFNTPVKLQVDQLAAFSSGDYNYVNVGLNITNIGYNLFEDPKLKFVIKTSSGASYPMSADTGSIDYKIQPQDNKVLNLITSIPKTIKLTNLQLQLVQDDETSKLSLPIATMQLPNITNQSLAVQPNIEKYIAVGSGKIAVKVSGATLLQSYDEHDLTVRLNFRNTSGTTVTIPKYQFEIQTVDGYRLPISTQVTDNLVLQPLEERVLNLTATIPANVSAKNPQFFINLPAITDSKDNFSYPIGIFAVPDVQPMQNMLGQKQFVQTSNGILGVTFSSLQRLPWSDGDLVSAKITISNTGFKTIMLPELVGQLKLDNAKLTTGTNLILTQGVGLLGANMSTDIYVVTKIPSYLDFNQLHVSLQEKIGESGISDWVHFANAGSIPEIPTIEDGSVYSIESAGRSEDIKVLRSFVYTGTSSDIIYTEIEVKNTEDHQLDLSQLTGSYISTGGQTYKAAVKQIDTSAGPDEKSVVTMWSKIPKKMSTSDMKLIVGEGITDNKLTPIKGEANGYINAAAMELNVNQPTIRGTLSDLGLFPYSLTVKNVRATLSGSPSVNVNFDYDLTRNMEYSIGEFEHKFLFELVDSTGRTFEKEFAPETDLRLTNGGTSSFSFSDSVFEDRKAGYYTLNVYDEFQGQRIKLGSQGFYYDSNLVD